MDSRDTYHQQTILGESGNCYATCIANLLGLRPNQVPNFNDPEFRDEWIIKRDDWLTSMGLSMNTNDHPPPKGSISIASGDLVQSYHAVLWKNGERYHDPGGPETPLFLEPPHLYEVLQVVDGRLLLSRLQEMSTKSTLPCYQHTCTTCQCFFVSEDIKGSTCTKCTPKKRKTK